MNTEPSCVNLVVCRAVVFLMKRLSQGDRNALWLEAHGFVRSNAFPGAWLAPAGEAHRFGLEENTAFDVRDCLSALNRRLQILSDSEACGAKRKILVG